MKYKVELGGYSKMKKFISISLATVMMVAGAVGLSSPVHAEENSSVPETYLQISPTTVRITLMGGDTVAGNSERCPNDTENECVMEVKNIGSKAFSYRVYVTPYVVKGENYDLDFSEAASTSYTQLSRWTTIMDGDGNYAKEAVFSIAPGETQKIHYRIEVPEDIPGGSQYAVIWAQTLGGASSGGVQAISQAGMVISGRSIGNTQQTAEVYDYGFDRFGFSGPLKAQATIKNTGNTDFSAYYTYTARTLFGKEITTIQDTIGTFPDTEYHINVNWENPPLLGIFLVEFRISGADTVKTETHIVVIMPIFAMILLILLLTVAITWIIIIIRKRKERKARTLV